MCASFHMVDLGRLKAQNTLGEGRSLQWFSMASGVRGLGLEPWSCRLTSVGLSIVLVSQMEVKIVLPALVGLYPEVNEPVCMEHQVQRLADSCFAIAMNYIAIDCFVMF